MTETNKERMNNNLVQKANEWLRQLIEGALGHELENRTLKGLKIVNAHRGFIRCSFIVSSYVTDKDGNWHAGAITSLIDNVGAVAIYSFSGYIGTSVDFSVSFYSTAKIQEEVEIDAKAVGDRGRLTSVLVEVRRIDDGKLIAMGKQWMTFNDTNKSKVTRASKL